MKLYPAQKKKKWKERMTEKERGKSNCRLETTARLEFYGKILQKSLIPQETDSQAKTTHTDKTFLKPSGL